MNAPGGVGRMTLIGSGNPKSGRHAIALTIPLTARWQPHLCAKYLLAKGATWSSFILQMQWNNKANLQLVTARMNVHLFIRLGWQTMASEKLK